MTLAHCHNEISVFSNYKNNFPRSLPVYLFRQNSVDSHLLIICSSSSHSLLQLIFRDVQPPKTSGLHEFCCVSGRRRVSPSAELPLPSLISCGHPVVSRGHGKIHIATGCSTGAGHCFFFFHCSWFFSYIDTYSASDWHSELRCLPSLTLH